jgi:carboxyl-terminal processing protease
VRINEKAELFGAPVADAPTVARLPRGATLALQAQGGGYFKVQLDKERTAFVRTQDAREARGVKVAPVKELALTTFRAPPDIQLSVNPAAGGVVADGERFTLSGTVSDPTGILDMYVLVNDQKVFFKGVDPKVDPHQVKFTTDFPLKEGNNSVLVVAREDAEFASRKTLVIRRRAPAVAEKVATPTGRTSPAPRQH